MWRPGPAANRGGARATSALSASSLPRSALSASALASLQRTAGNVAVQRLVRLTRPPGPSHTMAARERSAFIRAQFPAGPRRTRGLSIIEDMAATSDALLFSTPAELRVELIKRVTMSEVMRQTQTGVGGRRAFGYPFTKPSLYWGPRVNAAASAYWEPPVNDNYSLRRDRAKRRELRRTPRRERHTVFGDPGGSYEWRLNAAGRLDPYEAIMRLFVRQPPHRRSLVHCDYLVSLVHFRAFMASLGRAAFNARIAAYGPARIRLRWNLFSELQPATIARPGLGSIRLVVPANTGDLVVGDHVYFMNHPAYDVINRRIGNAWRLENAVLVQRRGGTDVFLGHGSGYRTDAQMRAKLAEEYNDVATIALRLVRRTRAGTPAQRAAARSELTSRFPGVVQVAGVWRIRGTGLLGVAVDMELRRLRASQVPGLRDPRNVSQMYPVRRAVESS